MENSKHCRMMSPHLQVIRDGTYTVSICSISTNLMHGIEAKLASHLRL